MRNIIFKLMVAVFVIGVPSFSYAKQLAGAGEHVLQHVWGSQRLPGAVWGLISADIDGDGINEIVILKRNAVDVARIEDAGLKIESSFEWDGLLEGVRLFTMDLDGDSIQEIVVSAVEDKRPSSFALKWTGAKFEFLFEDAPWHVRVIDENGTKKLLGQQWNTSSFFSGPVCELSLKGKKLKHKECLRLPKWARIFDFDFLGSGEDPNLVRLSGYSPIELYEKRGKKFKKIWSSGGRFGGGMNLVEAKEREPLGKADDEDVMIDREPLVASWRGKPLIVSVEHDVPLKGIIGKRPWIPRGKIIAFSEDPSLGYQDIFETESVSGYISDYLIYEEVQSAPAEKIKVGKKRVRSEPVYAKKLVVSVQLHPSMFRENQQSTVLVFDLPQ